MLSAAQGPATTTTGSSGGVCASSPVTRPDDRPPSQLPPQPSRRTLLPATTNTTTTTHQKQSPASHLTSSSAAGVVTTAAVMTTPAPAVASTSATVAAADTPPVPASRRTTTAATSANITHCPDASTCVTLADRIDSINQTVSADQAWALIHQSVLMYHTAVHSSGSAPLSAAAPLRVPLRPDGLCLHRDGSVHIVADASSEDGTTERAILLHLGFVLCTALHPHDHNPYVPPDLDEVFRIMMLEEDGHDGQTIDPADAAAQTLDGVLAMCRRRVDDEPTAGRGHYRAVCRALVMESLELRDFLRIVCKNGQSKTPNTQPNAGAGRLLSAADGLDAAAHLELQSFGFSEWTRFWMQVVEELRSGVQLKKHNATRPSQVFELTPYEILMEDIRSRNFELRKVLVDGEVPAEARVRPKHDAHAVILEFIRSRPPLRKATERQLAPLRVEPTPHEALMQSIRGGGQPLRQVPAEALTVPPERPHRRLIAVDMSLFDDDDDDEDEIIDGKQDNDERTKAAAAPIVQQTDVVQRRNKTTINNNVANNHNNNLNHQHNHRTSKRRHTIVGCQSNGDLTAASPPRPDSRESQHSVTINPLNPLNAMTQQALAEWTAMPLTDDDDDDDVDDADDDDDDGDIIIRHQHNDDDDVSMRDMSHLNQHHHHQQQHHHQHHHHQHPADLLDADIDIPHATPADLPEHTSDRLTLSLEEIVHIRSVMTKAELEGLPVGVQVKEDVERRKVCFLCLRTRFSLFRQWGVQCKLCQRTVCTKCHTKMRIPTEHFRNVPVMLLSASLMGSPVTAAAPLATLQQHQHQLLLDRPSAAYAHIAVGGGHSAGSAPATPRMYRRSTTHGAALPVHLPPQQQQHHNHHNHPLHMSASTTAVVTDHHSTAAAAAASNASATVRGAAHVLAMQQHQQQQQHEMAMMSRSMDASALSATSAQPPSGPHSLPPQSPAVSRSHPNTLGRQTRFARAFNRSPSRANTTTVNQPVDSCHRDVLRGELSSVCNDCRDLVNNICRSSKQTRSSARNKAMRNLTLDLSPVYK